MVNSTRLGAGVLVLLLTGPALAEDFKPEQVSVRDTIDPGPNVFVYQQKWDGAGSIAVFGRDDLAPKGLMSSGAMGAMLIGPDGKSAYVQSTFMKRITYGDVEQVVQIYDVAKLAPVKEVVLPPKAAMVLGYDSLFQQSADGKILYVQNATPAASVSVVDVEAGAVLSEIPTPGCWGIFPASSGHAFFTPCGDGTFATFTLSADGKSAEKAASDKVFDALTDPIFISAAKTPDAWLFATFKGDLLAMKEGEKTLTLAERIPLAAGIEGGWVPGGYNLMAYAATPGILFVGVHPNGKEGSHKDLAEEIWAFDLKARKVVSRTPVEHLASISVSGGDVPVLAGLTEDPKLIRYELDPTAGYALKKTLEAPLAGFPFQVAFSP